MKRLLIVTFGVSMLAAAGATAVSTPGNAMIDKSIATQAALTAEQTKVLQARYRYWSSSQPVALKTPI